MLLHKVIQDLDSHVGIVNLKWYRKFIFIQNLPPPINPPPSPLKKYQLVFLMTFMLPGQYLQYSTVLFLMFFNSSAKL